MSFIRTLLKLAALVVLPTLGTVACDSNPEWTAEREAELIQRCREAQDRALAGTEPDTAKVRLLKTEVCTCLLNKIKDHYPTYGQMGKTRRDSVNAVFNRYAMACTKALVRRVMPETIKGWPADKVENLRQLCRLTLLDMYKNKQITDQTLTHEDSICNCVTAGLQEDFTDYGDILTGRKDSVQAVVKARMAGCGVRPPADAKTTAP